MKTEEMNSKSPGDPSISTKNVLIMNGKEGKDDTKTEFPTFGNEENLAKHQQFELIFSPRTTYSNELEYQEMLYNDLTLNFDPITIKIIKKHFKERLGSLSIIQFIAILKNHLLSWHPNLPNREKKLIKLLHRLFQEVDLNNNGSMEWSEFCNYIIHNSNNSAALMGDEGGYKSKFYSLSKSFVDTKDYAEIISYMFYLEKYNLIGVVEEGKSVMHFFDAFTTKKTKALIDIKDIQRDLDLLENKELDDKMKLQAKEKKKKAGPDKKNTISDVDASENSSESSTRGGVSKVEKKEKKKKVFAKEGINMHESYKKVGIITTLFIVELDLLLVSQSNKKVTAWKYIAGEFVNDNNMKININSDNSHSTYEILFTSLPQYCMTWDSINRNLFTGQEDGKITKWDLFKSQPVGYLDCESALSDSEKEKSRSRARQAAVGKNDVVKKTKFKNDQKFIKKSQFETRDFVTSLLVINKIQVLAASYLNGKIILWDTLLMSKRKQYKNKLKTGIYQVVYDNTKNLLFSCGFDSKIMVYDPYIESEVYQLDGHMVSINNLVINEKENELLSYDINGNIKVWNTNNFVCTQTLNPYEGEYNISDSKKKRYNKAKSNIVMVKKTKQIFCYRKHLIKIYEVDKSLNPALCDDQVVFSSYYDKISKLIITVCLRKIKMWNPFTGKIIRIYEDPMKAEITALVLDPSYKRVFLGDNNGNIKCFNLKNGKFLKELEGHENSEISILIHSQILEKVISASIDNIIKIHDDKELTESVLIKELKILTYNIKSLVLMENLSRLVIGLSSGLCKFYDIEHFRYDSDINSDTYAVRDEVTALYQFNNFVPKFYEEKKYGSTEDASTRKRKDDTDDSLIHFYNLIFSAHSSGKCKLMWTPPSNLKFGVIYEFVHLNINSDDCQIMRGDASLVGTTIQGNDEKDYGHHTPVACIDFDYENYRLFTGDQIGKIRCYDFKPIFQKIDEFLMANDKNDKNWLKQIFNYNTGKGSIKATTVWYVEAHKESVKHIHYASINPNILITTSHDLRVKIFNADDGIFIDELKQGANKFPSVPIGIKYKGVDPITSNYHYSKILFKNIHTKRLSGDKSLYRIIPV